MIGIGVFRYYIYYDYMDRIIISIYAIINIGNMKKVENFWIFEGMIDK